MSNNYHKYCHKYISYLCHVAQLLKWKIKQNKNTVKTNNIT